MSGLTLCQSREALARANARVQAQRPNDLALALMVQRRYARRVAFLEGREVLGGSRIEEKWPNGEPTEAAV